MACGGCGHKYFRPPRTVQPGAVQRNRGVAPVQGVRYWRYIPKNAATPAPATTGKTAAVNPAAVSTTVKEK